RRHEIHQPRKISIGEFRFAGEKELMRLGCEGYGGARCARRIAADEAWELGSHQHEHCYSIGPVCARISDEEGSEARNLLVHCRDGAHQVVTTGWDAPETEPWVARDQTLEIPRRHDIQTVLADDGMQKRGVFLYHDCGKVEFALRHQLGLLEPPVRRQTDVEP